MISCLVPFFVAPAPLAAQTTAPTLTVEPFFDGHFKYGEWLPLRVNVANDGAPLSAELRVELSQSGNSNRWVQPIELPTGARKQVTLYVMPPSFAQAVRVRLFDGTREVASASAPLTLHPNAHYLVGVIAARSAAFNALNGVVLETGTRRAVHPLALTLDDIPDRVDGLFALDALAISDTDTSALSDAQKSALARWVREGGHLVLGGGASAARTLAGLPDSLVGWVGAGAPTDIAALDALGSFAGQPVRVPGPFTAAFPQTQAAVVRQGDLPLVSSQRVGDGVVTFAALDLSASPFDAWAGTPRFWQLLLSPYSAYPDNIPLDVSPRLIRTRLAAQSLQNLPVLALPSLNVLAILLGVYILLVGPLNYLLLRRFKKLDWGWATIPGLTVMFAVGAFGVSNQLRGSDVILNQISLAQLDADAAASEVETLVGVYSPTRGDFTLEFPGTSLVLPLVNDADPFGRTDVSAAGRVDIVLGEPIRVRNVEINQGALQAFSVRAAAPETWRVESALRVEGDTVLGTITNRMDKPLTDAFLLSGGHYLALGDLAPNESRTVNQAWQTYTGFPSSLLLGSGNRVDVRRQILDMYFGAWKGMPQLPARPVIIGWVDASPVQIGVVGTQPAAQETTLVMADAPLQLAGSTVHLTPGDWKINLVALQGERSMCGATNFIGVGKGAAVLEYVPTLPVPIARVTRLSLIIQENNPQSVELQDRAGSWVRLDVTGMGSHELPSPERFLSPQSSLRLRISSENPVDRCVRYDFELEGELE